MGLFGTDGVRGLANKELTARLSLRLGEAAARVLTKNSQYSRKRAIVGRDTRVSGEFIVSAVTAGLASAGVDVIDVGILPTPGIAYLTSKLGVDLGVVVSASHNPMPDNGIKFFSSTGNKLPDEVEAEIESHLEEPWERPIGENVGRVTFDYTTAQKHYVEHLLSSVCNKRSLSTRTNKTPLNGLKIVVDAANGAASYVGPEALRKAGADVIVINDSPDGYNINKNCGSTHPEQLQAMVVASSADLGIAFDGDADRCIAVDEKGNLVNGDKIITIIARFLKQNGQLKNNKVAITVMSNLGIHKALSSSDIDVEITSVGDRYVLERMLECDINFGGEQSGHIINLDYSTTGDGVLSALYLADVINKKRQEFNSKITLSELSEEIYTYPQILVNVDNVDKNAVDKSEDIKQAVIKVESELGQNGRVLLRPSGTEPLIRVMVEARSNDIAQRKAQELVDIVEKVAKL